MATRGIVVPLWLWDKADELGVTKEEAGEMLQKALRDVHLAAMIYTTRTLPRPRPAKQA